MVPLAQELGLAGQPEAAFPQRHARGVLGGTRAVVVLQLGQVGRVPLGDELRDERGMRAGVRGMGHISLAPRGSQTRLLCQVALG